MVIIIKGDRAATKVAGIGIDIIEGERIEKAVARWGDRFLLRIFTPAELMVNRGPNGIMRLAGRFAAKEAVLKALGLGLRLGRWVDIEITNDSKGRPGVILKGNLRRFAEQEGIGNVIISISHGRKYAVAEAIAFEVSGRGNDDR